MKNAFAISFSVVEIFAKQTETFKAEVRELTDVRWLSASRSSHRLNVYLGKFKRAGNWRCPVNRGAPSSPLGLKFESPNEML